MGHKLWDTLQRVVIQSLNHKNLYYKDLLKNHISKASELMCWLGLASDRSSSLHSDTTGTTESTGSLEVSENVQSDIWDNRGEFQPGLSYAHLPHCIFGSRRMPRSNSQTFSVPEQILLDPDLEHSSNTDTQPVTVQGCCHTNPLWVGDQGGAQSLLQLGGIVWLGRTGCISLVTCQKIVLQGYLHPEGLISSQSSSQLGEEETMFLRQQGSD